MTPVQEAAARLRQLAALEPKHPVLVCDGCGKCWPDDDASDSESCDCGRFKQRMEWADAVDVAKDAVKALELVPADDAEPITEIFLESIGFSKTYDAGHVLGQMGIEPDSELTWRVLIYDDEHRIHWATLDSTIATRGDVRALLKGLKLPLSESPARQEPT